MRCRAWFDIFYEHVNYFRLSDFDRMFGTVLESGHVFGGQYLYVVADLATLRTPAFDKDGTVVFPIEFLRSLDQMAGIARTGARHAAWGGASQGVIFSIYLLSAGGDIDDVIE